MLEIIERTDIGMSVKPEWKLCFVDCYISRETEKAIAIDTEFNFDAPDQITWIPKSMIKDIVTQGVIIPTWLAIKNGLDGISVTEFNA